MRYSKKYQDRGAVNKNEQLSYFQELKILIEDKKTWLQLVDATNDVYEQFGHDSEYRFNGVKEKRLNELSNSLLDCLQTTNYSININLLSTFKENYRVQLTNENLNQTSIYSDNSDIIFKLNLDKLPFQKKLSSRFSKTWDSFILEKSTPHELETIYYSALQDLE